MAKFDDWWEQDPGYSRGDANDRAVALATWSAASKQVLSDALVYLAGRKICTPAEGYSSIESAMSDAVSAGYRMGRADAVQEACTIIETADARNLHGDGPAGGQPPQMTLAEWRRLYKVLDQARQGAARPSAPASAPAGEFGKGL